MNGPEAGTARGRHRDPPGAEQRRIAGVALRSGADAVAQAPERAALHRVDGRD